MALTLIGTSAVNGSGLVGIPAGTLNGDIIILLAGHQGAATVPTLPAGFTQIDNSGGVNGPGALTCYRVASSEPASYTVTNANTGYLMVWRGQDTTTPINGHTLLRTASGTSCPSTNLTTTVNGCQLLWLVVSATSAAYTQPAGYTLESTATDFSAAADISQTSAGSAGTPTGSQANTAHQVALIAVAPAVAAPTNTVAPAVTGSAAVGSTLTTDNGTWTGSPTSFTYQWTSNGANVGTNQNTYVTQAGDVGHAVGCTVTATNAGGSTSQASNTITVTAAPSLSTVIAKTGTSGSAVMQKAKASWTYITQKTGTSGTAVDQKGAGSFTKIKGH